MILYLCVITVSAFAIAVIVTLTEQLKFLPTLSLVWLGVVAVILVDAITACLCRALPMRCANIEKSIFKVGQKEKRFYEKCKIRKWKDLIPEIGHFTGFRKNKIAQPNSVEYIDRFLLEIAYGQIVHTVSVLTGFGILFLFPIFNNWLKISIPVAAINGILNVFPTFVLRYNSYKLVILKKNLCKKQRKTAV